MRSGNIYIIFLGHGFALKLGNNTSVWAIFNISVWIQPVSFDAGSVESLQYHQQYDWSVCEALEDVDLTLYFGFHAEISLQLIGFTIVLADHVRASRHLSCKPSFYRIIQLYRMCKCELEKAPDQLLASI